MDLEPTTLQLVTQYLNHCTIAFLYIYTHDGGRITMPGHPDPVTTNEQTLSPSVRMRTIPADRPPLVREI
jgi:hypothetical protein